MLHHLVHLGIPPWEKAVRTAVVYAAILGLLHLAGKRALAQLNSFDLVVLLLLSNVVQNAIIGPDDSLLGGLLGAAILIGAQLRRRARRVHEPTPRRGCSRAAPRRCPRTARSTRTTLASLALTHGELVAGLRRQGLELEDTEKVTLEPEGIFNATPKPRPSLDDVMRKLNEIEAKLASRSEIAPRAEVDAVPAHGHDANAVRGIGRLDHLARCRRRSRRAGRSSATREEEIAGTQRVAGDRRSVVELRIGVARDRHAVRAEDVPDEAGAVEAPAREPAPEVAQADEALRLGDDRRGGRRQRRLDADRPSRPSGVRTTATSPPHLTSGRRVP